MAVSMVPVSDLLSVPSMDVLSASLTISKASFCAPLLRL